MTKKSILGAILFGLFLGISVFFIVARFTAPAPPSNISVTGEFGGPVVLTIDGEVTEPPGVTTLLEGDGRKVEAGGQVLLRTSSFLLRDGDLTATSSRTAAASLAPENIGAMSDWVSGKTEGSRLLAVVKNSATSYEFVVIDLLPTAAIGEMSSTGKSGLPIISQSGNIPVLTQPGAEPTELVTEVAIPGTGEQVSDTSVVVANYVRYLPDGTELENTWRAGAPVFIDLVEVFPGLRTGLADQRVGSRVIMGMPAELASGDTAIVMVVDILAISEVTQSGA
ncbi:MAG: hypothetical protein Q4E03_04705 [Trueperella sp.]|nr:hypothetical protein [Trueperella sp.]